MQIDAIDSSCETAKSEKLGNFSQIKLTCSRPFAAQQIDARTDEIDALISANVPRCVLEGSPKVRRLFPDYEAVERDYYRRTGIFPIMHTVVVTRELAEREPDVVQAVYRGFCNAKAVMAEELEHGMTFNNIAVMVPRLTGLLAQDRELLGADWWPYGTAANRTAVDALLRYHHEQGLTDRRLTAEEIFVPYLLDT